MEFSIKSTLPEKLKTDCIAIGIFETRKLSDAAKSIDSASGGHISGILKRGDMEGRSGSSLLLHHVPGIAAERVLLVGLGKEAEFAEKAYIDAIHTALEAIRNTGAKDAAFYFTAIPVKDRGAGWNIHHAVLEVMDSLYHFDKMKSKPEKKRDTLKKLSLFALDAGAELALKQGIAVAEGVNFAKDLGNLPGNVCTPSYLAGQALEIAKEFKLESRILEQKDMKSLGMGSLLSVARGSHEPPKLIVLEYRGAAKNKKPVVLVGKGITFDSGGISLKPGADMDEMKYDMCGAASVLGAIRAAAQMKLRLNIVAIVPSCENMPGGSATKPGDIVTSMSGQTIEVLNTDAEGRLILCDALTYAEKFEPETVVDVATLTGACVIALGHVASGLYSNDEALASELLEAGKQARDRAWQMPLWEDYQEQLKSNFADMANIGGRPAGSVTAACFLARFTKHFRWAHLDVAGTAHRSGKHKGSTGRPVPLLARFLIERSSGA
ncbi:MAG: leucyl aminopeptidase [Burkholderiales bacterium]